MTNPTTLGASPPGLTNRNTRSFGVANIMMDNKSFLHPTPLARPPVHGPVATHRVQGDSQLYQHPHGNFFYGDTIDQLNYHEPHEHELSMPSQDLIHLVSLSVRHGPLY